MKTLTLDGDGLVVIEQGPQQLDRDGKLLVDVDGKPVLTGTRRSFANGDQADKHRAMFAAELALPENAAVLAKLDAVVAARAQLAALDAAAKG